MTIGEPMPDPREAQEALSAPSDWIVRFASGIAPGGRVLDVAAGRGRHVRWLMGRGHRVVAVDREVRGLADLAGRDGVEIVEADLESGTAPAFGEGVFDGVVVTNYLWRPILPAIIRAVSAHGLLIYETFAVGNVRFGRPSNPDFLLRPGELLSAVQGELVPIAFEQVCLVRPDRVVQRIVAAGPDHDWVTMGGPPGP
ncbi:MAG: class I SAM-dependent methyltransferase [Hyphomicrobiaceae bacterium]